MSRLIFYGFSSIQGSEVAATCFFHPQSMWKKQPVARHQEIFIQQWWTFCPHLCQLTLGYIPTDWGNYRGHNQWIIHDDHHVPHSSWMFTILIRCHKGLYILYIYIHDIIDCGMPIIISVFHLIISFTGYIYIYIHIPTSWGYFTMVMATMSNLPDVGKAIKSWFLRLKTGWIPMIHRFGWFPR